MEVYNILKNLNYKQRKAVTAPKGNFLVLAGAGSGKTKVLVHRIAWLISVKKCSPYSVIAATFTNKAAVKMLNCIEYLLSTRHNSMCIGTFHGLAYRLLRSHYQDANLPQNFKIIDSEDQLRLLKRIIREMNLDDKKWTPIQARWYIDKKKDEGLRPKKDYGNSVEATLQDIYQIYQETCDRTGIVDFAELMLRSYELWINKQHILNYYRNRFTNILVDEFQDMNKIQYEWIKILVSNNSNIMIVGDDDQSIYGWRGANIKNIQRFIYDFSNAKIIRLEQNYRSTNNILQAANTLIAHNNSRLGKILWTKKIEGEPITLYHAFNELDEANFVVNSIKNNYIHGIDLKKCAILYRNNAQSRVLEETLLQASLAYSIYGGIRFFERQEIKDALSYLRLIDNHNDDSAYERVINMPPRGIGDRTLDLIRLISKKKKITLWQSSKILLTENLLNKRLNAALRNFLKLLDNLTKEISDLPLYLQTDRVIRNSGLLEMYEKEKSERGKIRIENLKELVTATSQFQLSYNKKNKDLKPLQSFLSHTVLEDNKSASSTKDAVQLMTLHSSKGLEFPYVFIVGMEEGMFPNKNSIKDKELLEEERRLAYVGITRAMEHLTIIYAKKRHINGKEVCYRPSRFISELPYTCFKKHSYVTKMKNKKNCRNI
ncbi:DNA helicase II [secondary endosymbiont of Trabutina mannipara]|uniref:DNA 3'-5' helicase n=1 Tax=secondary endosymbiont of Trabutina mannipara TaxID=1835721 RepID=A0A1C3L3Y5_9ENTR|nr:DNA helicase II [secondary endosymbiont of Trabutina mannipara]